MEKKRNDTFSEGLSSWTCLGQVLDTWTATGQPSNHYCGPAFRSDEVESSHLHRPGFIYRIVGFVEIRLSVLADMLAERVATIELRCSHFLLFTRTRSNFLRVTSNAKCYVHLVCVYE